jgi:outer membrane protein assembly factor BamB
MMAIAIAGLLGQEPNRDGSALTPLMPAELAWTATLDAAPLFSPVTDRERVYLALSNQSIVAVSRVDGLVTWMQPLEPTAPPSLAAGVLYVLTRSAIHALDATSGTERWQQPIVPHLDLPLVRLGDLIYGIATPATLIARRSTDGSVAFESPLPSPPSHAVAGDNQTIYLALANATVVALSSVDGHPTWQRMLTGRLTQPALVGDRLIVGSSENDVFALDTSRGGVSWRWRVGADVVGASGDDDTVFFAALDNLVRAVSRSSGNQRWKQPVSSRPAYAPEVFGDLVVVTSVAPTVSAFHAVTGRPAGTYVAPAELIGPVLLVPPSTAADVVMVAVTRDGRVLGLRPKPIAPEPPNAGPQPETDPTPEPAPADGTTPVPTPVPTPTAPPG